MDKQELKELIKQKTPLEFCRRYLFDQNVYLFDQKSENSAKGNYHDFKCEIGNALNTSPNNVAIIGSGKFGFSMNPSKKELLKEFNHGSDLDVVIVCPEKFEEIWTNLRKLYYTNQTNVKEIHAGDVFSKYLVVNHKMDYRSTYMRDTIGLLQELKKTINGMFRIKRVVNYRIYSNWSDVEDYHEHGISVLQGLLNGPRGDKI
ncbi:hypothetical protein C0W59_02690 [Photobacterium kishitanii]|uniref:hypothetical protein n=1 Tax=Photobacterium kishitanii TaxID=318456 RepID=UPI000D157DCC|nr:hypothetical protein [Photobacterium kishitanii]PSV18162.1 hypothetical protein C0W59_02690 [Photobacterium kishitanii]